MPGLAALTKGLCDFGMIRCAWGSHAVLTRSVSHEQLLCCSKLLSEFSQWIKPGISGLEKRFCLELASLAPSSPFSDVLGRLRMLPLLSLPSPLGCTEVLTQNKELGCSAVPTPQAP